ncbi:bifunctional diaminohydroxyphosphoribosylaminopyrimidine deaminase/5-amino-6-(5-phosphoribosylamino)uracil reductase RibD [Reichenbachiella carrageenanivorans]|uniref:Riboflavin biosynthesis protein RibD n=1 Tax=Reichenbachiella carrageenanivorans TaxID=2979869 RepID=A0ABY6D6K4_9BACT|nr:bifunctional diaminohydroxyphosphoribosylaminopyrimidine deaminase/5-amino-6-(5-phosphoribosylamino)uracil reductase RibD [Reichenbachiella carrageenanivorans]UXX80778.1 bifunctional diaminohydroxyphosphoribosylaminopyrimidine deaminase/5-amino-6-(5-phosphoribosylamino)uracil reductase RibD [Reichenbachiella carrageenanivorans]
MNNSIDEKYMQRALELAERGIGSVSPNPMAGCVIVHHNQIIGEGWHEKYGGAHAEVNAIKNVKNKTLLKESTAYVTLEPCAHFGKTPPCADLLIKHKLKRVVIANQDSFPLVNGGGIKKLTDAGIEVEVGVLSEEGRVLNKRFFTRVEKKRPYVILKWAQTVDGFVARENYDSKWISNAYSRKLVHKWRAEEDAIWVGTNTAKYDNPKLNVRDWQGSDPIRLVIDKQLSLDVNTPLFDQETPTICYNAKKNDKEVNLEWVKIDNVQWLDEIFLDLRQRGIQSVLVEGGAYLLQSLIDQDYWDEARVFTGSPSFTKGIKAPDLKVIANETLNVEGDKLELFYKDTFNIVCK